MDDNNARATYGFKRQYLIGDDCDGCLVQPIVAPVSIWRRIAEYLKCHFHDGTVGIFEDL